MKSIINVVALSSVLLVCSNSYAEDWVLIEESTVAENGQDLRANLYADKDSVKRKGDVSSIRTRINSRTGFVTAEFDCNKKQLLGIASAKDVDEGTTNQKLFDIACKPAWKFW